MPQSLHSEEVGANPSPFTNKTTIMYKEKLELMESKKINIPFTRKEIKSMPKGFTATSVKEYPAAVFPIRNKYIPIGINNEKYHA